MTIDEFFELFEEKVKTTTRSQGQWELVSYPDRVAIRFFPSPYSRHIRQCPIDFCGGNWAIQGGNLDLHLYDQSGIIRASDGWPQEGSNIRERILKVVGLGETDQSKR